MTTAPYLGQQPAQNVPFYIQSGDTLYYPDTLENPDGNNFDFAGCNMDINLLNEDGSIYFNISSYGGTPYITLVSGGVSPNIIINVPYSVSSTLIRGNYPWYMRLIDSTGKITTLATGVATIE